MSRLEIILSAFLTLSIIINIGLVVYVKAAISRLVLVSEELGDLQDMINSFLDHTRSVYEMEMFYGDQTLKGLMDHTKDLSAALEELQQVFFLSDDIKEEEDEKEEEE